MLYKTVTSENWPGVSYQATHISSSRHHSTSGSPSAVYSHSKWPSVSRTTTYNETWIYTAATPTGAYTGKEQRRMAVIFPATTVLEVRCRWTTNGFAASNLSLKREWIRLKHSNGTYTTVAGAAGRNSKTLTTTVVTGRWEDVISVEMQLYGYGRGQDSGWGQGAEPAMVEVRFGNMMVSSELTRTNFFIKENENRQLCACTEDTPLKLFDGTDIKNIAILEEDDPIVINADNAGVSKVHIGMDGTVKRLVTVPR